jgi:hypothetical protein
LHGWNPSEKLSSICHGLRPAPVFAVGSSGLRWLGKIRGDKKHYPKSLDNRMRDRDGEIGKKRSDTLVRTLREEYGPNFAKGHRANAKLGAVLKKEGLETLDQLLKKGRPSK